VNECFLVVVSGHIGIFVYSKRMRRKIKRCYSHCFVFTNYWNPVFNYYLNCWRRSRILITCTAGESRSPDLVMSACRSAHKQLSTIRLACSTGYWFSNLRVLLIYLLEGSKTDKSRICSNSPILLNQVSTKFSRVKQKSSLLLV
jgi:hypothetical protein